MTTSEEFSCMECGEAYPSCLCNTYRRDERLKSEYADWIGDRINLTARDGGIMPGYQFVFATLTFGCTRCGGFIGQHPDIGHIYLQPGPQSGRKRYKKYWDEMNSELVKYNSYVDVVYGAEERGSFNGRLHYHAIVRLHGELPDNTLNVMKDAWRAQDSILKKGHPYGWVKIEWLTSPERALAYVSKYIAKTGSDQQATPFFFFEYEPKSALDVVVPT